MHLYKLKRVDLEKYRLVIQERKVCGRARMILHVGRSGLSLTGTQ